MDTQSIIAELEAERDRLNSAIAALQSSQGKTRRDSIRQALWPETTPVGGSTEEDWPGHEETLGGEKEESSGMIQKGRTSCESRYSGQAHWRITLVGVQSDFGTISLAI